MTFVNKKTNTNCLSKSATLIADDITFGGCLGITSSTCPFTSLNPGGGLKTFYETIIVNSKFKMLKY